MAHDRMGGTAGDDGPAVGTHDGLLRTLLQPTDPVAEACHLRAQPSQFGTDDAQLASLPVALGRGGGGRHPHAGVVDVERLQGRTDGAHASTDVDGAAVGELQVAHVRLVRSRERARRGPRSAVPAGRLRWRGGHRQAARSGTVDSAGAGSVGARSVGARTPAPNTSSTQLS